MKAGECRIRVYKESGVQELISCLTARKGYISIPVQHECWEIGTSVGRYGQYVKVSGVCCSVNSAGYAYAKEGTEKAQALVKAIKAIGRELKKMASSKEEAKEQDKAAAMKAMAKKAIAIAKVGKLAAMPELSGTAKQVAWASELRQQLCATAQEISARAAQDEARQTMSSKYSFPKRSETVLQASRYITGCARTASWWIDHRSDLESQLDLVVKAIEGHYCPAKVVFCHPERGMAV